MKIIIYTNMRDVNRLLRSRLVSRGHDTEIVHNFSQLHEAIHNHSEIVFYLDENPDALSCLQKILTGKLSVSEFSPIAMLTQNRSDFISGKLGAHCVLQPPISLAGVDQSIIQMQSPKADFLFIDQIYIGLDRRQQPTQQRHNDRRLGQHPDTVRYKPNKLDEATIWQRGINQAELIARLNQFKTDLRSATHKEPIIRKLAHEMQNWGFTDTAIHNITQSQVFQAA